MTSQSPSNINTNSSDSVVHPVSPSRAISSHALVNQARNLWLYSYELATTNTFDQIYAVLRDIALMQHETDFVLRSQEQAVSRLGYELPWEELERAWVEPLDVRTLYAYCVQNTFQRLVNQQIDLNRFEDEEVHAARSFFSQCGFHEVDISSASDARLGGLARFVLRLPQQAMRQSKAYSGGLFDIQLDFRRWQRVELKRLRGANTTPDTRYLKVVVYNRSSLHSEESGSGEFRGHEIKMVEALIQRLYALRDSVRGSFLGADIEILLLGVDTDSDALRVHIPDSLGDLSPHRFIEADKLYDETLGLSADESMGLLQDAIEESIYTEGWGRGQGEPHSGMRLFVTQLLLNNLSQIDFVRRHHAGGYVDYQQSARFLLVGENIELLQLRNLIYFVHLFSVEESVDDLDDALRSFESIYFRRGLPVPVMVHFRYDHRVKGARDQAVLRCKRVSHALKAQYSHLDAKGLLRCFETVRSNDKNARLEVV